MLIYIDIDETICITPKNRNYADAIPILENIVKANKLYDKGHTVIYWTARGSGTNIDWLDVTIEQLNGWGVKFNQVKVGKPTYDLFICDKAMNTKDWV